MADPLLAALRVVTDAPATAEAAVVALDQSAEAPHVEASTGRIVYDLVESFPA